MHGASFLLVSQYCLKETRCGAAEPAGSACEMGLGRIRHSMNIKIKLIFLKLYIRKFYANKGADSSCSRGVKANEDLEVELEWLLQQLNIKAHFKFSQSSVSGSQKKAGP
jgi:hypothetical protein